MSGVELRRGQVISRESIVVWIVDKVVVFR